MLLDEAWTMSPSVSIRPEPFGALAYHFGTRRLTFLKSREMISVVTGLAACATVREALAKAGVPQTQWSVFLQALEALADGGMIERRADLAAA
jgi:putative mycofactocin binding protein MftB